LAAHAADTHRPERQVRWEPHPGLDVAVNEGRAVNARSNPTTWATPSRVQLDLPLGPATTRLPARVFDPPRPARVSLNADRPSYLNARGVKGCVTAVKGPHRLEGEWWSDRYQRDYFEVSVGAKGHYWIFCDRKQGEWFLQGAYD
jgi:hypothetical protein